MATLVERRVLPIYTAISPNFTTGIKHFRVFKTTENYTKIFGLVYDSAVGVVLKFSKSFWLFWVNGALTSRINPMSRHSSTVRIVADAKKSDLPRESSKTCCLLGLKMGNWDFSGCISMFSPNTWPTQGGGNCHPPPSIC